MLLTLCEILLSKCILKKLINLLLYLLYAQFYFIFIIRKERKMVMLQLKNLISIKRYFWIVIILLGT